MAAPGASPHQVLGLTWACVAGPRKLRLKLHQTDDRGIGLTEVAVFLLCPARSRLDGGRVSEFGADRMTTDRIPMSKEGYERRKAKLDKMKNEEMTRIAEQIAEARGFGDLSENAEFHAAVEAQGMLQARINELQNELGQAFIVAKPTGPSDQVVFGSKVRVLDLDLKEEEDFILVGPGDEDYDQNKILMTSPIGQALVGKKVGEQVEVQIPRGVLKLKIVEIGVA